MAVRTQAPGAVLADVAYGQAQQHGSSHAVRIETGTPGAVVTAVELSDGVIAQFNGAGSVVALVYPHGLED